ncbi:hypothetical protein NP493_890g00008, partial [Ridgeia piscesae]
VNITIPQDFLAIFAQNDLLADHRSLDLLRRAAPGSQTWNYTLPNLRKRPSRPTTLAPSVWASHSSFASTTKQGLENNGHNHDDRLSRSCSDKGPIAQSKNVVNRSERIDVSKSVPTTEDAASIRLKYVEAALRSRPQRPKNHIIDDAIPRMQEVNEKAYEA